MNQSIAKISGGKEIHGMSEYDPLGKYEQQRKKKSDAEAHSENVFEDSYCR